MANLVRCVIRFARLSPLWARGELHRMTALSGSDPNLERPVRFETKAILTLAPDF
jgi:hypothetical protein